MVTDTKVAERPGSKVTECRLLNGVAGKALEFERPNSHLSESEKQMQ